MNRRLSALLFTATMLTTLIAGSMMAGADITKDPMALAKGVPFAASLMLILGTHELAHYLASRRHGVAATWPLFIPAPSFIGTFGAFIQIRSPMPNRRALLDIGVSGPLAGFLVAFPLAVTGLGLSRVESTVETGGGIFLGSSLLFHLIERAVLGNLPESANIILHPVAFAAWIGFLVTAMNLLPIGQLDGGHILYAVTGRRHFSIARFFLLLLVPLGFFWQGWFLWGNLLVIMGFRHPPVIVEDLPLDGKRMVSAFLAALILVLTFTPVPFAVH